MMMAEYNLCTYTHVFNPVQPEMQSNCSCYLEYKPKTLIQTDISLFYQFKTDNLSHGSIPIIPDGCLDILFCCNKSYPYAMLATSPEQRCTYQFELNSEYFGVRLYPEQTLLTFRCSMKEMLQQQQIPLFDIVKTDPCIVEIVANLSSFKERVHYFHSLLKKIQHKDSYDQNLLKSCLQTIYTTHGLIHMKQLSEKTGYSERYIRKKFENYIGFAPKQFSQIIRFQHSIHELLNHQINLDKLMDQYGFFDEAHFYKGFKKFTTLTPKQYKEIYYTSKRMRQG